MSKIYFLTIALLSLESQLDLQTKTNHFLEISFIENNIGKRFFDQPNSITDDPCTATKKGATIATALAKENVFKIAVNEIKKLFKLDLKEHAVAFGKDSNKNIISSCISNGTTISGSIPKIANAFADIHNHPNNTPPDAGDLYGLITINKNNTAYDTRFIITSTGTVYALLITDHLAATSFEIAYPQQPPAFKGGPPGFPIKLVDEFNNSKDVLVFLISLKAGGTGLNLTSANLVIHFDPWWNPAVEDQATDRAHRIGQKKVVEVIKLVAKGTIEEKIILLQENKKELIDSVITGELTNSEVLGKFTREELLELFDGV